MSNKNDFKTIDKLVNAWASRHEQEFYSGELVSWVFKYLHEQPLSDQPYQIHGAINLENIVDYYNRSQCLMDTKELHFKRLMNAWRAYKQKKGKHAYSILLSAETHQLFEDLQRELRVNKSKIFEDAIIAYHKKKVKFNQPS